MRKMQLSPRYIVLVCVFLLSSCLLAAGNVAGKCAQSSSQPSVPAQLAIEAYEREDFGQSVKYFNEAVSQSPDSLILQLHLANAQAHWFMHDPHDPEARTRIDAAETTLKDILRKSPESRLALWDLAAIYAMDGRAQDSQKTLAILLHNDPNDSDALTASGTIAAMQIHFDIQAEKRKRNIRLENAARIVDEGIRESLRSEFEPQIQTAVHLLNRAIQNNTQSSQPLVMLNLLYRMEAELAKTDQDSQALLHKADALVDQVMAMNQQQEQHRTTAQKKLSPLEAPPPLPGPPPPPPPPPKPPGS